jgi:hypothetical protein
MEYEVIGHDYGIWLSAVSPEGVLAGAREAVSETVEESGGVKRARTVREALVVTCDGMYDGALTTAARAGCSTVDGRVASPERLREWSVTVEAFGRVSTRRFSASTRREAEEAALREVGFRVASKEVVPV